MGMEKDINKEKEDMMTVYEVSYLLLPSLAVEQVSSTVDFITKKIKELDGAVISSESPILIDLAYPMTKVIQTNRHKCQSAYFGWVKFEMSRDSVEGVKKTLDTSDDVLRYLLVKTVRENTLLNGKMMLRKEESLKKEEGDTDDVVEDVVPEEPTTPEEIDKSIDDLVIN
ncbi:MAG: small subunit ribosomal protein [Patescibacteria group bacterium]|jgi:ribosomal protein S6|nr:small subunit ribosomal protein [Patescibacteria group bacterium]